MMMNRTTRTILVIAAVLLLAAPVFAVTVTVDWQWARNDAAVQYFRYQLNGEAPDGWTVVGGDVLSCSYEGLDGSLSHTLYLQQSYDGMVWSASASVSSDPVVPSEPVVEAPVVEAPVVEETPAPVAEPEPAQGAEEPVAEAPEESAPATESSGIQESLPSSSTTTAATLVSAEPVSGAADASSEASSVPTDPVSEPKLFTFNLGLAGGMPLDGIGSGSIDQALDANIKLNFENILVAGPVGFDIRAALGVEADPLYALSDISFDNVFSLSKYRKSAYFDLMVGGNVDLGPTTLYLAGGARLLGQWGFGPDPLFSVSSMNCYVQPTALLGLRFNIGSVFSIGIEGQYVYFFEANSHSVTPRLTLGFSF